MKKRFITAILVVIMAAAWGRHVMRHDSVEQGQTVPIVEKVPVVMATPQPVTQAAGKTSCEMANCDDKKPLETEKIELPKVESLETEITSNPHETPHEIIAFGERMAPSMEKAQKSETYAVQFFSQLEKCAKTPGDETPNSIRAMCFVNGARLARLYPRSLNTRLMQLKSDTPKEVSLIARGMGY